MYKLCSDDVSLMKHDEKQNQSIAVTRPITMMRNLFMVSVFFVMYTVYFSECLSI